MYGILTSRIDWNTWGTIGNQIGKQKSKTELIQRPLIQLFVEAPLAAVIALSLYKLSTAGFESFIPFFLADPLKLHQIGRELSPLCLHSTVKV